MESGNRNRFGEEERRCFLTLVKSIALRKRKKDRLNNNFASWDQRQG
jgi:hypothetical protein